MKKKQIKIEVKQSTYSDYQSEVGKILDDLVENLKHSEDQIQNFSGTLNKVTTNTEDLGENLDNLIQEVTSNGK